MTSDNQITLSYSTINNCLQPDNSHNWLNKQMGLEPEDHPWYHQGNECHRIIQDHVAGIKKHPSLAHITEVFPVVEKVDRDPDCHFEIPLTAGMKDGSQKSFLVHGYIDGIDKENDRFLEIKSSSTPWGIGKFNSAMQRKIYGLSGDYKLSYLITCKRDPEEWKKNPPKIFKVPVTAADRVEAIEWIQKAVQIIAEGKFDGGLEDGKCVNPRCYYGVNCGFK